MKEAYEFHRRRIDAWERLLKKCTVVTPMGAEIAPTWCYRLCVTAVYHGYDVLPPKIRKICNDYNIEVIQMLEMLQRKSQDDILRNFNEQKWQMVPPVVDTRSKRD